MTIYTVTVVVDDESIVPVLSQVGDALSLVAKKIPFYAPEDFTVARAFYFSPEEVASVPVAPVVTVAAIEAAA